MTPTTTGLDDVQGNILKGHGRKYTALVFFHFSARVGQAAFANNRRLLREAANGLHEEIAITSAKTQQRQSDEHKAHPETEFPFISLGLTTHGLAACDYTADNLGMRGQLGSDQFWGGATRDLLGDPLPWEKTFEDKPDGVFMLAHAVRDRCVAMVAAAQKILREQYGIVECQVEWGFRWTPRAPADEKTYEHFGFADGFARTKIATKNSASALTHLVDDRNLFLKGTVEPFEIPLEQVMIDEAGPFCGGSFLVINKLEQNVRAFLKAEQYLEGQRTLLPASIRPKEAGALFIGRERSGVPLVRGATTPTDRFHFGRDGQGKRCPFMAHIRKMNPRQNKLYDRPHAQAERTVQKSAQFVRRGVLYGDEAKASLHWPKPEDAPQEGVGLLFMGYMTRTGGQFLKMYFNWGPEPQFPQADSGPDPLLGGGGQPWNWPQHPSLIKPGETLKLDPFVTSKGAAFFIVPPLQWLRSIT